MCTCVQQRLVQSWNRNGTAKASTFLENSIGKLTTVGTDHLDCAFQRTGAPSNSISYFGMLHTASCGSLTGVRKTNQSGMHTSVSARHDAVRIFVTIPTCMYSWQTNYSCLAFPAISLLKRAEAGDCSFKYVNAHNTLVLNVLKSTC